MQEHSQHPIAYIVMIRLSNDDLSAARVSECWRRIGTFLLKCSDEDKPHVMFVTPDKSVGSILVSTKSAPEYIAKGLFSYNDAVKGASILLNGDEVMVAEIGRRTVGALGSGSWEWMTKHLAPRPR